MVSNANEWILSFKNRVLENAPEEIITKTDFRSFEVYNFFFNSISFTSKSNLIIYLNYLKEFGNLESIKYGKCYENADFKIMTFPTVANRHMKFTPELKFFSYHSLNKEKIFCNWMLFCIHVMNPETKILNPNVNFANDQRLVGHLMGTDRNNFIMNYIYKNFYSANTLTADSKKGEIVREAAPYNKKRSKDPPAKFVKSNAAITTSGRLFDKSSSKILSTNYSLLEIFSLSIEKNKIKKEFLEQALSNKSIMSLAVILDLKVNIVIFTVIRAETKGGSKRVYNLTSIDSYMNKNEPEVFFVLKEFADNKTFYILLKEESDDKKIDMKVYTDSRIDLTNLNSFLIPFTVEEVIDSPKVMSKEVFLKTAEETKFDEESQYLYETYYAYLAKKTFRLLDVKFFVNQENLRKNLSNLLGINVDCDYSSYVEAVKQNWKYISHSDLTKTFIFCISLNDIKEDSKINIDEMFITGFEKNSESSVWLISKDCMSEMIYVRDAYDIIIDIERKHHVEVKAVKNESSSLVISTYYQLFNDFKKWEIVEYIKKNILSKSEANMEECMRFIKSNLVPLSQRNLEEIIESIEKLNKMTLYEYFLDFNKFGKEDTISQSNPQLIITKEITEDQDNLKMYLSSIRFRYAHPNLDHNSNLKRIILSKLPDLTNSNFLADVPFDEDPIKLVQNFQLKNNIFFEFAVCYVISYQGINHKMFIESYKLSTTIGYTPGSVFLVYNIITKKLYYAIQDLQGTLRINFSGLHDFEIIDNSDTYNLINKLSAEKNINKDFNFEDKSLMLFISKNSNILNRVVSDEFLKHIMISQDQFLVSLGKKEIFSNFYKRQSTLELETLKLSEKKNELSFLEESIEILKFFNYEDIESFKKFWFSFSYTENEKKLFDIIIKMINSKILINHPASNIEGFFKEVSMLISGTLNSKVERAKVEVIKQSENLSQLVKKTEVSLKEKEIFDDLLDTLDSLMKSEEVRNIDELDDMLTKKYGIFDLIRFYERNLSMEEKESLIEYGLIASFDIDKGISHFNDLFLKYYLNKELKADDLSNKEVILETFLVDRSLDYFSKYNHELRRCLTTCNDTKKIITFLSEYTAMINEFFVSKNNKIKYEKRDLDCNSVLSNFMSWTHLRHDMLSLIFSSNILNTENLELDDSFGNYFTGLSRTPDLIMTNNTKDKLLVIEFTYSHNEFKGKLAKGISLESAKYYPELYTIYNSEIFEEIYHLPIVFSKFLSEKSYEWYNNLEKQLKIISDQGFSINLANFAKFTDQICEITQTFLESTNLIYNPKGLFNFLIAEKNRFSFNINSKYNCVEYNTEAVDTAFADDEPVRRIIHLIFGKYLYHDLSRDELIKIINDYKNKPIVIEDVEDLEDLERIPESWLINIFNQIVFSFGMQDFSKIHSGTMNFYREFFKRANSFFFKNKPPFSPYYADGNFFLNEFYQRVISSRISSFNILMKINSSIFPTLRIPRTDIIKYYKGSCTLISGSKNIFIRKQSKKVIVKTSSENLKIQLGRLKSQLNNLRKKIFHIQKEDSLKLFLSMESCSDFEETYNFFLKHGKLISSVLDEKQFVLKALGDERFVDRIVMNIFRIHKTLVVFSKFSDKAEEILIRNNKLNRSLQDIQSVFKEIASVSQAEYEEEREKEQREKEEKQKQLLKEERRKKKLERFRLIYNSVDIEEKMNKIDEEIEESVQKEENELKEKEEILSIYKNIIESSEMTNENKEGILNDMITFKNELLEKMKEKLSKYNILKISDKSFEDEEKESHIKREKLEFIQQMERSILDETLLESVEKDFEKSRDEVANTVDIGISKIEQIPVDFYKSEAYEGEMRYIKPLEIEFDKNWKESKTMIKTNPIKAIRQDLEIKETEDNIKLNEADSLLDTRPILSEIPLSWDFSDISLTDLIEHSIDNTKMFIFSENLIRRHVLPVRILSADINWCVKTESLSNIIIDLLAKVKYLDEKGELPYDDDKIKLLNIMSNNVIHIIENRKEKNILENYLNSQKEAEKFKFFKIVSDNKECSSHNILHLAEDFSKSQVYSFYDICGSCDLEYRHGLIIVKYSVFFEKWLKELQYLCLDKSLIISREKRKIMFLRDDKGMIEVDYDKLKNNYALYPTRAISSLSGDIDLINIIIDKNKRKHFINPWESNYKNKFEKINKTDVSTKQRLLDKNKKIKIKKNSFEFNLYQTEINEDLILEEVI